MTPKSQVNKIKTKNTRLNKTNDKNKKRSTNDEMSKPKKSSHRNILEYVFHLSLLLGYNYIININYAITEYKIETFKERWMNHPMKCQMWFAVENREISRRW